MAHSRLIFLSLVFIVVSATACTPQSTSAVPSITPTSTPLATQTTVPALEPTARPSPTLGPTATPTGTGLFLPIGVASFPTTSGNVGGYSLQGTSIGELQVPNFSNVPNQQAVFAGPLTTAPGLDFPPFVYYVYSNGGELWQNSANNNTLLKAAPNLLNITAAPGKPFIAYTLMEYLDVGLRSDLYLTDLQALPTAQPVLQTTSSESYALQSLAITVEKDQPVGVWYTSVPIGIGGDIIFAPRKTLNYLRLADYQILTYLNMTQAPVGMSDDQTWVAYTSAGGNGPMNIVHNFDFATAITFPLRTDSDRGSGDAVFSPDNLYVAWREAGGSLSGKPAPLRETIRIASVDGTILSEIQDTSLVAASGLPEVSWVIPLGWLDPQTLALEVQAGSASNAAILAVKFDGSAITYLVPGSFIGFLYP